MPCGTLSRAVGGLDVADIDTKALISTGIEGLDTLLGGGIPARQILVVTGDPGTGKTTLASQVAFSYAARGEHVVIATIVSEPHDKLLAELRGFEFFDPELIGQEIYLLSAYAALQKGPRETRELLVQGMRDRRAKLFILDGFRAVRDVWHYEAKLRDFLYELNVGLAQLDAIGILTTEYPLPRLLELPEATTVDGIVALSGYRVGSRLVRRAEVAKLRGRPHLTGEHLLRITAEGIHIVPRLEEVTAPDVDFEPPRTRAAFGLPELDEILRGGLPRQSTTLLAGSTGTGKTLLGLQFAAAGARMDEVAIHINYAEPRQRLIVRAQGIGLDVQPLVDAGTLHLHYRSFARLEADDLVAEILDLSRRHRAQRLIIDGLGELEQAIVDRDRIRPLLSSLINELRDLGVTAIFLKEVPRLGTQELDLSDTPISVIAENVLFLRHVELGGRLHRVASVLKMRESGHDSYVRELEITERGIRVLGALESAEGLPTGVVRMVPARADERR